MCIAEGKAYFIYEYGMKKNYSIEKGAGSLLIRPLTIASFFPYPIDVTTREDKTLRIFLVAASIATVCLVSVYLSCPMSVCLSVYLSCPMSVCLSCVCCM